MLWKKFSVCIFYSVFAHFIHININRSTREHIKNNICAILNSYNKDGSGQFLATFSRRNVPKSHCIIGVKGMHVSAFDGFSQKVFFDRIRTQLVLWMHWSLFLCKTNKNYLRTKLVRKWLSISPDRTLAGGGSSLCEFLLAVSSKLFQLNGGQLHHDRLSVLKSARCLASSRVFIFLAAAGCCLVGNLVAPLLDGLNDL